MQKNPYCNRCKTSFDTVDYTRDYTRWLACSTAVLPKKTLILILLKNQTFDKKDSIVHINNYYLRLY